MRVVNAWNMVEEDEDKRQAAPEIDRIGLADHLKIDVSLMPDQVRGG
jgi:hypothetical protein